MGRLALRRLTTTLLNEQEVNGKAVPVMPAKTGIQWACDGPRIPARAGMTRSSNLTV